MLATIRLCSFLRQYIRKTCVYTQQNTYPEEYPLKLLLNFNFSYHVSHRNFRKLIFDSLLEQLVREQGMTELKLKKHQRLNIKEYLKKLHALKK